VGFIVALGARVDLLEAVDLILGFGNIDILKDDEASREAIEEGKVEQKQKELDYSELKSGNGN